MTPQLLAAEMADLEERALAEVDRTKTVFEAAGPVDVTDTATDPLLVLMDPARKELLSAIRGIVRKPQLVRVTPYRRQLGQQVERLYTVMVLRTDRREAILPRGTHIEIVQMLRSAMPDAPWTTVALDYDTRTGALTPYIPRVPACLREAS